MARLNKNKYQLKSATLVEAIISILIISISFSIGLAVILNSIQPFKTLDKVSLDAAINSMIINTKEQNYYIDETKKYKEFSIEKTVTNVANYEDVLQIHFKVRNTKNKITYERIEWVYVP